MTCTGVISVMILTRDAARPPRKKVKISTSLIWAELIFVDSSRSSYRSFFGRARMPQALLCTHFWSAMLLNPYAHNSGGLCAHTSSPVVHTQKVLWMLINISSTTWTWLKHQAHNISSTPARKESHGYNHGRDKATSTCRSEEMITSVVRLVLPAGSRDEGGGLIRLLYARDYDC